MKRCPGLYGFVLVIAFLGLSLLSPAAAAGADSRWTLEPGTPVPQYPIVETSSASSLDQTRIYRWIIPEGKSPTPFGYPAGVTIRAKSEQTTRREPVAMLSPDLIYLAIGSDTWGVQIVDRIKKQKTTNYLPIRQLMKGQPDAARGVQDLAFHRSADKMTLIVADGGRELTLWDVAGGDRLASLAHDRAGDRITFAPGPKDSLIVAIGSQLRRCDYALQKWDPRRQEFPGSITGIAVSEYGRVVAVATADHSITLLDGETLKSLHSWKHGDGKSDTESRVSLAVSPKGDRVFMVTDESQGTVTVWDAKTGNKTSSFTHRDPNGTPGKILRLSATLDGKVETQWVSPNGYGHQPALWSPPEGVEFAPPPDLWLVHAKAVKIVGKEGVLEVSEWVILHAYTGDPELRGKSLTLRILPVLGTTLDRIRGYRVQPGDEDIWWIKRRKVEGDLVGELDFRTLERCDPEGAFPCWQSGQLVGSPKELAVLLEKLNDCDRDSERVRLLVKYALGDSACASSWSVWWLVPATSRSSVPSLEAKKALESRKPFKLVIAHSAVERVVGRATSAGDFYNLACCFSLLARSASTERDQKSNAWRAIELFEQAIEKGWDDADRVKNDGDLDFLRGRDDFKKLLAVLEARKATRPSKMK